MITLHNNNICKLNHSAPSTIFHVSLVTHIGTFGQAISVIKRCSRIDSSFNLAKDNLTSTTWERSWILSWHLSHQISHLQPHPPLPSAKSQRPIEPNLCCGPDYTCLLFLLKGGGTKIQVSNVSSGMSIYRFLLPDMPLVRSTLVHLRPKTT